MFGYMYMEVVTKKASKIIKDGSKARESRRMRKSQAEDCHSLFLGTIVFGTFDILTKGIYLGFPVAQ